MAGDNKDKLQIRLHVYDTDMSVTVMRQDEEYYRKAAKLITSTVNTYASVFKAKRSEKDILYMALIDVALRYEKELARNDVEPYGKAMSQLTSEIEDALKG
jgi:hypothetical protein